MASGTVMTHLAYLNNLAQNSKAPAVYVGNNPYNAQYEKPESETDKQLAKLKLKTEQARASSLKSGSALALQKFEMAKEKNALEMQIKRDQLKTQSDIANNLDTALYSPDVALTEDREGETSKNVDVFSNGAQADDLTKQLNDMQKKQGFKALTPEEKQFELEMAAIDDDRVMSDNDKIEKKMELGKKFGFIPTDPVTGEAIDESETLGDAAEWTWDAVVDPLAEGLSKFGNIFRTKKEADEKNKQWDQYGEYQDEYSGTSHKDNLFKKFNQIKIQRKKNENITKNMERYALKKVKEQSVKTVVKTKVTEKGVLVPKAKLDKALKQSTSAELNKIRGMNITPAAKVELSKTVIAAHQAKVAEWQSKKDAQAKALEELRKAKVEIEKEKAKIEAQMTKEIAVDAAKGTAEHNKAKIRKLNQETKKIDKEMKQSSGWW